MFRPSKSFVLAMLGVGLFAAGARAGEVRDPMRPANAAAPAAPRALSVQSLRLEGVISGEQRIAIVNGRLVRAGDVIAGARILEVFATGVRYERAGRIFTLSMPQPSPNPAVRVARAHEEPRS